MVLAGTVPGIYGIGGGSLLSPNLAGRGLIIGYLGAALQPRLPEKALRFTLGVLAITTAGFYGVQALS